MTHFQEKLIISNKKKNKQINEAIDKDLNSEDLAPDAGVQKVEFLIL